MHVPLAHSSPDGQGVASSQAAPEGAPGPAGKSSFEQPDRANTTAIAANRCVNRDCARAVT